MRDADLVLAVDGGGSRTQALIADRQGNVVARGLGPSGNLHTLGVADLGRAVMVAIDGAVTGLVGLQAALQEGARKRVPFSAACFGLAGIDSAEDEAEVSRWVREQGIATRFTVVNDSELVLAAGTPEGWGVALISGTGSVCLGRTADGRTARVGGWGPLIGDEGSGYAIATAALRAAACQSDGRAPNTGLLEAVVGHWQLDGPSTLIRYVHAPERTPAELATLATVVVERAAKGDPVAVGVMDSAARELADQVKAVVRRLKLVQPPLALGGSLLHGQFRRVVLAALSGTVGAAAFVADPSQGAVALAGRLAAHGPGAA